MKKIISFFIHKPIIVNFILIFILLGGIISITKIKKDVFPLSDIDTVVIYITYPGASPKDVELNALVPVERKLASINGIKEYTSYAIENQGTVYAYIDPDAPDKRRIKDDIFRTITLSNVDDLGDEVEEIKVVDINPKLMAVLNIALTPKDLSVPTKELYNSADKLEKKLLGTTGVSEVRKSGYSDREIHISVDPSKIEEYYASLEEIITSIQSRNIRETGGTIQSVQREENIVTIGQFGNYQDVGKVIIRSNFAAENVKVEDVAEIKDSFKESSTRVKVNGKDAVILSVVKKESADVIDTIKNVKAMIQAEGPTISADIDVRIIDDKSKSIDALLGVVLSNAAIGFLLVFVILLLFFDLHTSFWTAFGIPVTLFAVLIVMNGADLSINMISLGAIITVLGMLVDHGIVISEIIYQDKETRGSSAESIVESVRSILPPVITTILTTIAAFIPMLVIGGTMGKFIYIFPVIITITLVASFLEAVFFLPTHLAHSKSETKEKRWFEKLANMYEKLLKKAIDLRYAVVGIFILVLLLTLFISRGTIANYVLIWDDSADAVFINLEAPDGTPLNQTEKMTMELMPKIKKIIKADELISVNANIGHHTVKRLNSQGNRENWSQFLIYLVPKSERSRNASQIIGALRKEINPTTVKGFKKVMFKQRVIGPAPGEAFDLKIAAGDNPKNAGLLLKDIVTYIKEVEGVKDIRTDQAKGKDEIQVDFNYAKLAQYGMNVSTVARTVRSAYDGIVATSVQTPKARLDFRVMMNDEYKRDKAFLSSLLIPNNQSALIQLKEIASFKNSPGKAVINHYNGEPVYTISAGVDGKTLTSAQLTDLVKEHFKDYSQNYPQTELIFGGEARETAESFGGLVSAFALAVIFIYFVLVLLFNSPTQPLVVLLSIPFGITGALLAFTLHGIPLSFMGIVGIIGLAGVVVNDSVVMVDFINKVSSKGGDFKAAVVEGAKKRFRPVILTTVTTVAGLMPTVYGIGGDAKTLVPTVMAMAYGLLFATLITLIFIPAFYAINRDIGRIVSNKK